MKKILTIALLFIAIASAGGIEIVELNAPLQERYLTLTKELRCLVCQNQNLAESNASLAADMRAVIARMLKQGDSDEDIILFMTERYGDFVLYRPPFKWNTAALWGLPFALVLILLLSLPLLYRRHKVLLDEQQNARAEQLLKERVDK